MPERIDRSAFLYFDPDDADDDFAQCSDCCFFTGSRCALLGSMVTADMSCGAFVPGEYDGTPIKKRLTPEDVGLVSRQVRCENCVYGGPRCKFYEALNQSMPERFDLDARIKPKGCCNAQTPKE